MHPAHQRQFSLKWKAMALTSLVLIAIVLGFTTLSQANLAAQFEQQQALLHEARVKTLGGLVERAKRELARTASLTGDLGGIESALVSGEPDQLVRTFARYWGELQLDQGLDSAKFYGPDNRLRAAFGQSDPLTSLASGPPPWIEKANREERPVTALACGRECRLYAAAPLMVEGNREGVVLFASSLSDIVLGFQALTGTDIGLVVVDDAAADDVGTGRALPVWHAYLLALTNATERLPLLMATARRYRPEDVEAGVLETWEGLQFRIQSVSLAGYSGGTSGEWILISDVSQPIAEIKAATKKIIFLGVSGLLVAELLLAALLWRPLSRLRSTAETLPLLGSGDFESARSAIAARSRTFMWFADESDILDATAIDLSRRLETLEAGVRSRTETLRSRARDLQRERDFVRRLLDTAQAVVITLDSELRILALNRFGVDLLNPKSREGVKFSDILVPQDRTDENLWPLAELAAGRQHRFQHGARVSGRDGAAHDIAWRHSRTETGEGGMTVLSVGLDVSEQRDAERRIAWLADHDPLTNLYNRRRFQEELQRAIAEAKRYDHEGSLLYLDLDQFKVINDASGHQNGDLVLKAVAKTLLATVRGTDIVCRLGGDEFAVLLPETDAGGAFDTAGKIQTALSELRIGDDDQMQGMSASIGIALYPSHGDDMHDLLVIADLAMYQAKDSGRGRWQLYSAENQGREQMRAELETKAIVERALAEERLVFHFQPILDLRSNVVTHAEALIRMVDPDGRVRMPGEFIGVAERSGLIRAIDNYVLRRAVREVEAFIESGHEIQISLNLSAYAFDDKDFFPKVKVLLNEHPGVAEYLIFEITETAAVTDFATAHGAMEMMRELGCTFSIDDFGTGFSSLKYLKQLPVDYVKIDGVFIRDLVDKTDDQILVQAVIEVARVFGKRTVAEFVEREDVLDWLHEHGADYAQGYHIGRPVPRDEFVALLGARGTSGKTSGPVSGNAPS
ncbi:MAG: EAL domain-containing protein [Pseudomonadota bacterium]|nr:EAL domain-containing protein [Pseudomonadota bacterium]